MLIPQLGYGGAEKSFVRLANYLSAYHNITIVLFDKNFGASYSANSADIINESIQIKILSPHQNPVIRWYKRWSEFRRLKKDANISISFLSGTNMLNVFTFTNTPAIVSERGSKKYDFLITGWKRTLWLKILDPLIYRMSDNIVSVSKGLSSEILENRAHLIEKVTTIEGYIDSKKLVSQSRESVDDIFNQFKNYPTIVTAGRLSKEKGYEHLLYAFREVKKSVPDSKLLLIGDGPEENRLKNICKSLGLKYSSNLSDIHEIDIFFAGYQKNPIRFFKLGRVFVFPSLYEGLPNALIEALASGVPALAADCPWGSKSVLGISETIDTLPAKSYNCLLMPMIDSNEGKKIWADYMVKFLESPLEQYDEEHSLAHIQRFDLTNTGKTWLELLEKLGKKK